MTNRTIWVCLIVGILGIAAAAAGFLAEATRVKKSQLTVIKNGFELYCEYPSSPAMGFAIGATVALVLARTIITSASGGCCSCCQTNPGLAILARICIVISWITTTVAVILFVAGAKLSTHKGVEMQEVDGVYYCYTIRPGIFSGAGIMGLVGVLLSIVYYLFYVSAINGTTKTPAGIELEAPPVTDGKKPPVAVTSRKH